MKRPSNRRQSPHTLIAQCLDIGVRLAQTQRMPTPAQLQRRYGLSLATAYRRHAQVLGYLQQFGARRKLRRNDPGIP